MPHHLTRSRPGPAPLLGLTPADGDTHALCALGLFHSRWRFDPKRCRARSRATQAAARRVHWRESIALARAHLAAARRLGCRGTFLACALRSHARRAAS